MSKLGEFFRRVRFLLSRNRLYQELDEEIEMHRQMRLEDEAKFGNATRWKEISREVWVTASLDALVQDIRFGLRQLRRNFSVTATIAVSLALGLGPTTAMFSLMNALLLKSLPVPEPERLITVMHGTADDNGPSMSYAAFEHLHARSEKWADLFAFSGWDVQFSSPVERNVSLGVVSGNYYSALQLQPQLGRLLGPMDNQRGSSAGNAVVLSDRLWRASFQADPAVLGRKVMLDRAPFIVIGVAPKGFFGVSPGSYEEASITFAGTLAFDPKGVTLDCRECNTAEVMGRLKQGVSAAQAEAALKVPWRSVWREILTSKMSTLFRQNAEADQLSLLPGGSGPESYLRDTFVKPLFVLLGMSVLILLLVCSNVSNLLLARAQARRRELAVRLSTGASRNRIVRQLLTESAILAWFGLAGGALVYQVCVWGLLWFLQGRGWEVSFDTSPDARMLCFTVGLTVLTVLLFGLIPALRASEMTNRTALAGSSHQASSKAKLGRGMMAAQIAVSFTLLAGAMLLTRSLYELRHFDAGFRRDHLLVATPDLSKAHLNQFDQLRLAQQLMTRIEALPGIRSASASTLVPGRGEMWAELYLPDGDVYRDSHDAECFVNYVSPRFFETMGTPVLQGNALTSSDTAVVSDSFARHFWKKGNPIGNLVYNIDNKQRFRIVGVARDARHSNFRRAAPRTVYLRFPPPPSANGKLWGFSIEVWTQTNPESLVTAVRNVFHDENSAIPVTLHTLNELIDRRFIYERLLTSISISFGALGAIVSAIGMYGVAAYSASRRTVEVGIRMAVGATRLQIVRLFVREHLVLAFVGVVMGVIGALALTRFLQSWLFGVSTVDIPSYAAGAIILAGVTAIATFIPASRAVRIEPWQALRTDA